jgi:hypothetical protein
MIRTLIAGAALAALSMNAAFAATAASAPASKSTAKKPAAKPAPKAAEPEAPLSQGQLDVAKRVMTGTAECEFKEKVEVTAASEAGHFHVTFGKATYSMVPKETTTGAVVLVDLSKDVEWLQIPSKSMLLDQKSHHRLVTECQQSEQKTAANG